MGQYSGTLGPDFLKRSPPSAKLSPKRGSQKTHRKYVLKRYRKKDKIKANKVQKSDKKVVKIGKKEGSGTVSKKVTFLEEAQVPFRCSRCSGSIEITFPQGAEKSSKMSRKSMKNREK